MVPEDPPEWRLLAVASAVLILDSLAFGIAPRGPWDDAGFTSGAIGVIGMGLGYASWYRFTFERRGLIPWIDLWKDPEGSAKKEMAVAALVMGLAWIAGNPLQSHLPDPTGLMLTLVGLLMALQSFYVILVLGPLNED